MIKQKALITSANSRIALAVTRSLGRKGIDVTCVDSNKNSISFYSKYCKKKLICPDQEKKPIDFIHFLLEEVKNNHYDVLFPISDTDVFLVSKYSREFLPYVKIPLEDHRKFMQVLDKSILTRIALKIGVPVPKTIFVNDIDELNNISKVLSFPMIIKPRQSSALMGKEIISETNTKYITTKEDFLLKYKSLHKKIPFPIIQDYVPGKEMGIFVLFQKGELKAIFGHNRIRSISPMGGISVLRESIAIDQTMKEYALKLLEELNWNGVAMVEFKIDSRDNIPKLLEINGRFWGSLQLAISSGVDFPYLLFKMAICEDIEPVLNYKKGVKSRFLLGDIVHLFNVMKGSPNNYFDYPKRSHTLVNFMKFYEKNLFYDDISFSDPMVNIKILTDIFIGLSKTFLKKMWLR